MARPIREYSDFDSPEGASARFRKRHRVRVVYLLLMAGLLPGCQAPGGDNKASEETESQMTSDGFDLQGHRGARGLYPENSLPGFIAAAELGVTTLEMDVIVSGDGEIVVSHDPYFNPDICSDPEGAPVSAEAATPLYSLDYATIREYDCGSRGNPRFPEQVKMTVFKPTLREVFGEIEAHARRSGRAPLHYNIETKSTPAGDHVLHPTPASFASILYGVLQESGVVERAIIQSFDMRTLVAMRNLDPSLRLAVLTADEAEFSRFSEALGFLAEIFSPDYRLVDAAMLREVHGLGVQVVPWTVNDVEEMQRLIDLGVDGLITDYPDRAIKVLESR